MSVSPATGQCVCVRSALHIALGTYVRVRVQAARDADCDAALTAAGDAIEACEARFSLYRKSSELCQLNARAALSAVPVSEAMFALLSLSDAISTSSDYLFDPSVGGVLSRAGLRPGAAHATHWQDVVLNSAQRTVHYLRPLTLDFGGIAKGFAVDCAVDAAMLCGASGVLIDAGGDMRAAGLLAHDIRVRDPRNAQRSMPLMRLENAAVATSGGSGAVRETDDGEFVIPTVHPAHADFASRYPTMLTRESVSVTAPRCAVADALTKVVQLSGNVHHPLLARFNAQAIRIDATNATHYVIEATRAAA